jgi:hypothetical protein
MIASTCSTSTGIAIASQKTLFFWLLLLDLELELCTTILYYLLLLSSIIYH